MNDLKFTTAGDYMKTNERIRELVLQAGITTNIDTDYFEKDMNKWVDYFSEKFAELIVKECIQELEISRKCDPYTGKLFDCEYNTCIKEQTTMLKEYFGVEE